MRLAVPGPGAELVADFSSVAPRILADARRHHPRECCGFIWEADGELRIHPTRNAADWGPEQEFFIAPYDQYVALSYIDIEGGVVRGIYHSHPHGTPTPSERDRAFAKLWPGVAMLIATETAIRAYTPSGEEIWGS